MVFHNLVHKKRRGSGKFYGLSLCLLLLLTADGQVKHFYAAVVSDLCVGHVDVREEGVVRVPHHLVRRVERAPVVPA